MKKTVTFELDEDLYEKSSLALNLEKEDEKETLEKLIRNYILKTNKSFKPKNISGNINSYYGKAENRIPKWALKPEQYNHKIIKAYFTAVDIAGEASITMMERLCSDKEHSELYVPNFKSNYSQMKIDGPKSHGKIFEDNGDKVWIWNEIKDTLFRYKGSFYNEEI